MHFASRRFAQVHWLSISGWYVVAFFMAIACGGAESTSTAASGPTGAGGLVHEAGAVGSGGDVSASGHAGMGTGGTSQVSDSGGAGSVFEAGADVVAGNCNDDNDCVIREGCPTCGICQAKTDPPPMTHFMCELCAPVNPSCRCFDHHCGAGVVGDAGTCNTNAECGSGRLCVSYVATTAVIHTEKKCKDDPCPPSSLSCDCAATLCTEFGIGFCSVSGDALTCANGGK